MVVIETILKKCYLKIRLNEILSNKYFKLLRQIDDNHTIFINEN